MRYLLFPGRQLAFTPFQELYLRSILAKGLDTEVVFCITSMNQADCRYNPIPFHLRAIHVDRFAQALGCKFHVLGIPHLRVMLPREYVSRVIKHASAAIGFSLTPENSDVVVSTPGLLESWAAAGFNIYPCEGSIPAESRTAPIDVIKAVADGDDGLFLGKANAVTAKFFEDYPDVGAQVRILWGDPLVGEQGDISDSRSYDTYSGDMQANIGRKLEQLLPHIQEGRISDEGCADGSLIAQLVSIFPDSDFFGVDISREFAARFAERQRRGDFQGAYTYFHHRNLMTPVFADNTVATTLCNSTLHEIWSYNGGEGALRDYLRMKFAQTKNGGRFVARDVVGPDHRARHIILTCQGTLRSGWETLPIAQTNVAERFARFAREFARPFDIRPLEVNGQTRFAVSLGRAMEFAAKIDYVENWGSEMKEEFCFWSHDEFRAALEGVGFRMVDVEADGTAASRALVEQWLVENRFQGRIALEDVDGGGVLEWPVTHQVLVAEKALY